MCQPAVQKETVLGWWFFLFSRFDFYFSSGVRVGCLDMFMFTMLHMFSPVLHDHVMISAFFCCIQYEIMPVIYVMSLI